MSKPLVERVPFAKIMVVLAVAFGVGLGLCGLDSALLDRFRSPNEEFGPNTIIGGIGASAMLLSALGLVVTVLLWVASGMVSGFSRKGSEPQRQFVDKDDKDQGDNAQS